MTTVNKASRRQPRVEPLIAPALDLDADVEQMAEILAATAGWRAAPAALELASRATGRGDLGESEQWSRVAASVERHLRPRRADRPVSPMEDGAGMKLLLIEDNQSLSDLLRKALVQSGFNVDALGTAGDADEVLRISRYDVVVLDPGLPDSDGLDLLRRMRGRGDITPVFILTARGTLNDRIAGLDAGADDYGVKPFPIEELLARLRALLRRPGQMVGPSMSLGNVSFDMTTREVYVGGRLTLLSARELSLLELLLRRRRHVVPKRIIESNLYGIADEILSNAAEVYVHRLRRQLDAAGADIRIVTRRGIGYMLVPVHEVNAAG